jgi:hypothetical protein
LNPSRPAEKVQNDPHGRDYIYFYEYFHGDNGEGLGASHQTGWTGLAARFVQALHLDSQQTLQSGTRLVPKQRSGRVKNRRPVESVFQERTLESLQKKLLLVFPNGVCAVRNVPFPGVWGKVHPSLRA